MKKTIAIIALVWSSGFMMACGAINNAPQNNALNSLGYVSQSVSDQKAQEMARSLIAWPYYIGKYFSAR
jgi:hypothetical protein